MSSTSGGTAYDLLFGLFGEMNTPGVTQGGRFEGTPYFNGGLYSSVEPFDLTTEEVVALGPICRPCRPPGGEGAHPPRDEPLRSRYLALDSLLSG